jgi:hypothetical protein
MVEGYQKRISGPLMDRIDIHVEVPPVDYEKLSGQTTAEPSAAVRARGPTTACSSWRGPSPIWRGWRRFRRRIWPRLYNIGAGRGSEILSSYPGARRFMIIPYTL